MISWLLLIALCSCHNGQVESQPQPIEKAVSLDAGGRYEVDEREMAASAAVGLAMAYEQANPDEEKAMVARKYEQIALKYPETVAGRAAAKKAIELLGQDR